jgi:prepilin-type N-terminal cleavage/methylation domain-containing protein
VTKAALKKALSSRAGLSLIETLVAAAIVAIAALILVSFVYTLTGVSKRSADLSEADAKLTETIALDPDDPDADSNPMDITLNGVTINTTRNTYEIDIGEFSTFSYPPSSTSEP